MSLNRVGETFVNIWLAKSKWGRGAKVVFGKFSIANKRKKCILTKKCGGGQASPATPGLTGSECKYQNALSSFINLLGRGQSKRFQSVEGKSKQGILINYNLHKYFSKKIAGYFLRTGQTADYTNFNCPHKFSLGNNRRTGVNAQHCKVCQIFSA